MISNNSQLLCAPELKRYILTNNFNSDQHLVTINHLKEMFENDPEGLQKVMSGRHKSWFIEDYFER